MLQSLICFPGLWNWRAEQWTVSIMAQGASSNTLSHSRATSPIPESHKVGRNLCWRPLCFTSMRSHSHHYFPLSQQSTCSQRILAKLWWNGVNIAEFSNEMSFLSFRSKSIFLAFNLQRDYSFIWSSFKANFSSHDVPNERSSFLTSMQSTVRYWCTAIPGQ